MIVLLGRVGQTNKYNDVINDSFYFLYESFISIMHKTWSQYVFYKYKTII